jgi:predicted phosphodiesterase
MKKFLFCTDLHGDHQNYDAVNAVLEFAKIYKPDVKIFGGDLFDFRAIRRAASQAEKRDSMEDDVAAGLEFLGKFKPDIFLRGNHDERIWDSAKYAEHGLIRDAAKMGVRDIEKRCRRMKCKMLPYDSRLGVYDLGRVRFIHGFHCGLYAAKKHAEVYAREGGAVLFGHVHSIQAASIARKGGAHGYAVGCLADLNPEYNRHQTAKLMHQHGFAYGVVDGKDWQVFQAKPNEKGKWVLAKGMVEI